ncbi:hat family dimerization domain-containing protein [Moniliophthora roreri MCA 2997]|uniref:Hat family dimerization domain-containing protein n=1 Tax=Moniliophthora roreri (strain MCA 2997) TaxID=1381753 RepID=V2WLB4_MONRO|nr:hat family dimerization domain-containing protein [Moniliophthora roreri MCA 2997]
MGAVSWLPQCLVHTLKALYHRDLEFMFLILLNTLFVDFTCIPQNLNAGSGMDGQCDKHSDDVYTLFMETATNYLCDICLEIQAKSENPVLIKVGTYGLKSSITNMRKHLLLHLPIWVAHCDHLGIVIDAKTVSDQVAAYWAENNVLVPATMQLKFKPFTMQGLSQRLMELIIAEDLPISFVESERVIHLVLYLRQNLTKANILGCTTMSKVIIETWYCQMHELAKEIMGALGKISFTCDGWTDSTLYPFIAITVHWIKEVVITDKAKDGVKTRTVLQFCSDVLAFHELPQSHTGAHLGEAFLYLVNHLGLLKKIGWITCDNTSNNETMCGRLGYHLQGMGIDFDEVLNHIRCFAHIIHLAVTVILDKIDKVDLATIFAAKDGGTLPANHKPGVLTRTRGMVPHAFQHFLSTDGTPCLAYTIPAFHAVINRWIRLQEEYSDFVDIIQQGINKLKKYLDRIIKVPAYFLSMLIHPNIKLDWIEQNCRYHKANILDTFHAKLRQRRSGGSNLHTNDPQPQPSQASSSGKQDDDWA